MAPQNNWEVKNPLQLGSILLAYEKIKNDSGINVSLADLIVLGGNVGIEKAAKEAGHSISVPFMAGRGDALAEQTDAASFEVLEPRADGFRNYKNKNCRSITEELLVDKAQQLTLTAAEMTVLLGGMRTIHTNFDGSLHGVLTSRPGALSNAFCVNLLDLSTA